jgi:Ca-activated chloride channel homolog
MRVGLFILCLFIAGCGTQTQRQNNSGNSAFYDEQYDVALRNYHTAQVNDPDKPVSYFNAASAYYQTGEYQQAIAALEQALTNAEGQIAVDSYYNLGNIYASLGEYGTAIEIYQQGLRLDPDDEDMRYNLEIALLRYIDPTPTAQQQQTKPENDQTDPEVTPTNNPGGFDGPTPTPPPQDIDPEATPETGAGQDGSEQSSTPVPQSQGQMNVEQAERILDQIQQDQQALREFSQEEGGEGDISEKDW